MKWFISAGLVVLLSLPVNAQDFPAAIVGQANDARARIVKAQDKIVSAEQAVTERQQELAKAEQSLAQAKADREAAMEEVQLATELKVLLEAELAKAKDLKASLGGDPDLLRANIQGKEMALQNAIAAYGAASPKATLARQGLEEARRDQQKLIRATNAVITAEKDLEEAGKLGNPGRDALKAAQKFREKDAKLKEKERAVRNANASLETAKQALEAARAASIPALGQEHLLASIEELERQVVLTNAAREKGDEVLAGKVKVVADAHNQLASRVQTVEQGTGVLAGRVSKTEDRLTSAEGRLMAAEDNIAALVRRVDGLETRIQEVARRGLTPEQARMLEVAYNTAVKLQGLELTPEQQAKLHAILGHADAIVASVTTPGRRLYAYEKRVRTYTYCGRPRTVCEMALVPFITKS